MPEYRTVEQQEMAATQYWQGLIARDRAARASDVQTLRSAQSQVAQDDMRLRQDAAQGRRARQNLTMGY